MAQGLMGAALLAQVAATGYQIAESRKQRKQTQAQADADKAEAQALQADMAKEMADQANKESIATEQSTKKSRQKALALSSGGRKGTLLTGPSGLNASGTANNDYKSLLGS